MKFTYRGRDGVDLTLRNLRDGDVIDVPDHLAGRPYSEERDPETGEVTHRDHGTGLLAQPDVWEHAADEDPAGLDGEPPAAPVDLEALTVPQLRKVAEERDVDLTGLTRKPDIVAAISDATTNEEA